MRMRIGAFALVMFAAADAASAATIVVYTDPMTLARHTVVYDTPGPHRMFMCVAPPGEGGCTAVPIKQRR